MPKNLSRTKPDKPHPDFPLTANGNGQWSKKIKGRVCYFGAWADPDGALERYLEDQDYLLAGQKPRRKRDGLTVVDLVNRFLTVKHGLVESGELTRRSWNDYNSSCSRVLESFGRNRIIEDLGVDDFEQLRGELAGGRNAVTLGNEIQRVRTLFKYAFDADLVTSPVKCGPTFKRPGKKVRRRARIAQGPRVFTSQEIQDLLNSASDQMKAMILLAINSGFGNTDCATLPIHKLDLDAGRHTYGRPKTGVERRCPLWGETVRTLRHVLETRKEPADGADSDLVFITKYRRRWIRQPNNQSKSWSDSIAQEFRKLVTEVGIDRNGASFYSLRRTFRTVGDAAADQPAVTYIMGHADDDSDMSSVYRQEIDDSRLKVVTDHVYSWLFPTVEPFQRQER